MRYETWYYLHFYTYLAVALAFSHQFATGADFMNNLAARVAVGRLYAAVAAAILWYRFITPVRQASRHRMRVARGARARRPASSASSSAAGTSTSCGAEPGQFFRWRFLARGLWWASSPYSLSAARDPTGCASPSRTLGDHSRALAAAAPGHPGHRRGPVRGAHRRAPPPAARCC